MADRRLLAHEVSDLCLGKPPLRFLPISATIHHALAVLKTSDDTHITIWTCSHDLHHHHSTAIDQLSDHCHCVGKICMVDIICYLCKQDNISSPLMALDSPVSVLLSHVQTVVKHVDPNYSLLDAIDLMINGVQNLVIPIKNTSENSKRKQFRQLNSIAPTIHSSGREFCWLTQEDVIRFLLSLIGLFSPTGACSIQSLGIIKTEILTINYDSPASEALEAISTSLADQTSVTVVDEDGVLIGEISPITLTYCNEVVAAAIMTLSAGELMAYIDCGDPPEDIIRIVKSRLKDMNLYEMPDEFSIYSSGIPYCNTSSSSDEETVPSTATTMFGRYNRSNSFSGRIMRRAEAVVCYPGSSLVAVMIQAIAFRVSYLWVIDQEDCSVVGIVKFSGMLEVFREHVERLIN